MKCIVILWMMTGLVCTLSPAIPGTLMVALGALGYGLMTEASFPPFFIGGTLAVVIIAEWGSRMARSYLDRKYALRFIVDTAVGNFAGVLLTSAFIGTLPGILVWQTFIGKTLMPKGDVFTQVSLYLLWICLMRCVCSLLLFGLTIRYLFMQ